MSKDQTATKSSYLFSIASFETEGRLHGISVDFTAPFNLGKSSNSIVPAFCKDGQFFTPAFILPREKEYYQTNTSFERKLFQQRIRKAHTNTKDEVRHQHVQLSVVGPDKNYCQICKCSFTAYIDHIKEERHTVGIRSSPANAYILDLVTRYRRQEDPKPHQRKNKQIQKKKQSHLLTRSKQSNPTQGRCR